MTLTFKEYQERTFTTAVYRDSIGKIFEPMIGLDRDQRACVNRLRTLLNLSYVGLGLGEVGEIQGKIKKIIRDSGGVITDEHRKMIGKELGDLLWYVSETCSQLGLSMGDVADWNLEKLQGRKDRGTLGGSGDER